MSSSHYRGKIIGMFAFCRTADASDDTYSHRSYVVVLSCRKEINECIAFVS